jgi:hypothetical protein
MALTQISTAGVKDDAVTSGKIPANAVGSSELADNAVDNAAVASNAAIAGSKIVPSFTANTTITAASPVLRLADSTDPVGTDGVVGKLEFYGSDGSSGGADVRSFIQTISTNSVGNAHALTIGLGESNNAPTEKIRILGDGKVGIGTTSIDRPLHIFNNSGAIVKMEANYSGSVTGIEGVLTASGANRYVVGMYGKVVNTSNTESDVARIRFYNEQASPTTPDGSATPTEKVRITSSGSVLVGTTSDSIYNDTSGGGFNLKTNGQLVLAKETTSAADPLVWLNDTGQTTNKAIVFAQDGSEKANIGLAGNDATITVAGSERMRIDSSGRVLLGTTTTGRLARLHISGDNFPTFALGGSQVPLIVSNQDEDYGLQLGTFSSGNGAIQVTRNDGVATAYNLQLQPSGGSVIVGNSSTGGDILFANTSGGIVLGSTTNVDSNTLDDYEEGTFTPYIAGSSTAGSWSSAGGNGGFYVKIGRQVTCWINAQGTVSGASGSAYVYGLPFNSAGGNTPAGSGNANYSAGSVQYWAGAGADVQGALIVTGQSRIYFHTDNGAATGGEPSVTNGSNNLHVQVSYWVA